MRPVAIIGVGMTPVGEHWDKSLRMLGAEAIELALSDAHLDAVDALYLGNSYGTTFSSQSHLGALVADYAGLRNIEAYAIEAGDASGGAALRTGYLAVASGAVNLALVVGAEKSSDSIGSSRVEGRNVSLDADFESIHGATLPALAAMLMRRYMHEYGVDLASFEGFSINAHANGKRNPLAMYRNIIKAGAFAKAPFVSDPVNLFDGAPDADGAAAVILAPLEWAMDRVGQPIKISGSAVATDTLALHDRKDPLYLKSVALSTQKALAQADKTHDQLDLLELHDAFTILTTLAFEAMGYADRGAGWRLTDKIGLTGELPISTFGGLKSRGNPTGATGVYQAVEAVLQLRGEANENQVSNAKTALIQNLGGIATTAITHVLETI
ncbi:MAG: thiolase domain-containing protein [Anaerolineae bacterium]|nr:thiolase domain-containing protein [Anaerolineae bacterium]